MSKAETFSSLSVIDILICVDLYQPIYLPRWSRSVWFHNETSSQGVRPAESLNTPLFVEELYAKQKKVELKQYLCLQKLLHETDKQRDGKIVRKKVICQIIGVEGKKQTPTSEIALQQWIDVDPC